MYFDTSRIVTGDLNGDRVPDLVIGRHGAGAEKQRQGFIWILYGPVGEADRDRTSAKPDVVILGADERDALGIGLATADLDLDGSDDLIAVAPSQRLGAPGSHGFQRRARDPA